MFAAGPWLSSALAARSTAPLDDDEKERPKPPEEPKPLDPEATFEILKAQWEKGRAAPIEERIIAVSEFASAPCAKTVDFLKGLYQSEKNAGIHMEVTRTLGKIGTEAAVQHVINVGLPLLVEDAFGVLAVADALENKLEPRAEQWVLQQGLKAPGLRKHKELWVRVVRSVARFQNPQRVTVLAAELGRGEPEATIAILSALEDTEDRRLVAAATKLLTHSDPEVQTAAMSLLFTQGGASQRAVFEKALKSPHWQVRVLGLRTLARLEHRKLADFAAKGLDDADPRVQVVAVRVLLDRGGAEVVLPLIRAIDKAKGRVRDDILDALTRLTGEDLGPSTFQWEGWWEQKGSKLREFEKRSAEEFSRLKEEKEIDANTVSYHGLRVLSDRFAFVFDSSESMQEEYVPRAERVEEGAKEGAKGKTVARRPGEAKGDGKKAPQRKKKLDVAKAELKKVLGGLPDGKHFDIIAFESVITDFAREVLGKDENRLAVLAPSVRDKAIAFVDSCIPQGQTYMLKALEAAFANEDVDTIYLLSDGAPTPPETAGMEVILDRVRKLNRLRCVKINTIGFDLKAKEKEFLRQLADEHFGVFIER